MQDEQIADLERLRRDGAFDEALLIARQITTDEPVDATAWWQLALTAAGSDDFITEEAALKETMKLAPAWPTARAQYGLHLERRNDLPGAIEAFQESVSLDPTYAFGFEAMARVAAAQGDLVHEASALRSLEDLGNLTWQDTNRLGLIYRKRQMHRLAAEYFDKAAAMVPGGSVDMLFNVGLAYSQPEISQDLDAADAYRKALKLSPNDDELRDSLDAIVARLGPLATRALAGAEGLLRDTDLEEAYISPFDILGTDPQTYSDLDPASVRKLKRRSAHELELNDGMVNCGRVSRRIDIGRALKLIEELEDEDSDELNFHRSIFFDRPLIEFLSTGSISLFTYRDEYVPLVDRRTMDSVRWAGRLSRLFSKQYSLLLARAIDRRVISVIEAMLDGRRYILRSDEDKVFDAARRQLDLALEPLDALAASSANEVDEAEIDGLLQDGSDRCGLLTLLNIMSDHFREQKDRAAARLRDIAVTANNKHGDSELASRILKQADRLEFKSAELNRKLAADTEVVQQNVDDERKTSAYLRFGERSFSITKLGVAFGDQKAAVSEIESIRWGAIREIDDVLDVSMVIKPDQGPPITLGWRFASNDLEQVETWEQLVRAASHHLAFGLVQRFESVLASGKSTFLATVRVEEAGVWLTRRGWVTTNEVLVDWKHLDVSFGNGTMLLRQSSDRRTEAVIQMRETENAEVLEALIRLRKDRR